MEARDSKPIYEIVARERVILLYVICMTHPCRAVVYPNLTSASTLAAAVFVTIRISILIIVASTALDFY